MSKVKFIFCAHNHQPIGNFGWVFEKAYQVAYKPFMQVMLKHPKIKWSLHASGMLWEYISGEHPDYIKNVKRLVANGTLEILSGGYYEPILSTIPDRDKAGQVKKMTAYLKDKFGCEEAGGVWLAERVWEPSMAKVLSESGIKYTVLDDAHFASAGMDVDSLKGYYTTEEQGHLLNIFPISQRLRYLIPFQDVEKTIEYFKSLVEQNPDSDPIVVMADDGEKFGMWPGTNKHVYENGWLEKLLTAIEENSDIVETVTFADVLKTEKSSGRVYLPCASYFEMSEWSLPSSAQQKFEDVLHRYGGDQEARTFLRGGFWRNFLTKYPEANNMHKKMLYVSAKIDKYVKDKKPHAQQALDSLYAGQCNCSYWHGVFGGLYLPHLRKAVYGMLLKAEDFYNKSLLKRARWTVFDFDCDVNDEYLYESKNQNIYISPSAGGTIFEWDFFSVNHNFTDVLTRRCESYHKKLRDNINNAVLADDNEKEVQTIHSDAVKVKEFGLEKYLVYDSYKRASLVDHFLVSDIKYEDFAFSRYEEKGDFVSACYGCETKGLKIVLSRNGKVGNQNVKVTKTISPHSGGYNTEYEIINNSTENLDICFAPEQMFAFSSKTGDDTADLKEMKVWKRYDDYLKIELELKFSENCDLFVYPVETVALSENGYEKTYQGTCVVPLFKYSLQPEENICFSFDTSINLK
ncbi:MAG: DUF1926 domain-containing protein [Endomicrobia bacterium]|nr:DUF1926 domain-containing protein [Endomicrobiia bacterium]MCL2507241.1 DUF1926 domain-containing protein [Endomicrobiia bacterium]